MNSPFCFCPVAPNFTDLAKRYIEDAYHHDVRCFAGDILLEVLNSNVQWLTPVGQ